MKRWTVLVLAWCVLLVLVAAYSTVPPQYSGEVTAFDGKNLELKTGEGRVNLVLCEDVGVVPGRYVSLEELIPGTRVKVLCGDYKENGLPMAKKIYVLNEATVAAVGEKSTCPVQTVDGILFAVLEGTVTPASVQVVLVNNAFDELVYGSDYYVERKVDETWYRVEYKFDGIGFTAEGYALRRGHEATKQLTWTVAHGVLEPGEYRIVKPVLDFRGTGNFTEYWLAAEFTLTQ